MGCQDNINEILANLNPDQIYTTIGLYSNETYKVNGVIGENLQKHIDYNVVFRFGRALFVDGVCVYSGYFTQEDAETVFKKLKLDNSIPVRNDTAPYV